MGKRRPALERFTEKYRIDPDTGCWQWTASMKSNGYGSFGSGVGREIVYAHRWAYEHYVGPIPDGLQLDHLCRNRGCVNPSHLEPVTARENLMRGETRTAALAAKTHCPRGHPYDAANTYRPPKGGRDCRKCRTEAKRRSDARRRARVDPSTPHPLRT